MGGDKKTIRGTREWAVANIDCCTGCSHGCRYCYARYDAVVKRGEVTPEAWQKCRVRPEDVKRSQKHYDGQVMFPCTHDIIPENLDACIQVIEYLLHSGNKILIVSKPHLECIESLCDHFMDARDSLLFRFTITSQNDDILEFWEPGAPRFAERLASLKHGHESGYKTSVSIEPMLDAANVIDLIAILEPFVTHSIWLGKMNKIEKRVEIDSREMEAEIKRINNEQSDAEILKLYQRLHNRPLVFWKESIKEVVGLELANTPGLDK